MARATFRRGAKPTPPPDPPDVRELSRALTDSREGLLAEYLPVLEEKLAAVFEKAGEEAARRFRARALDFLTAAAPSAGATMVAVYPDPEEALALTRSGGVPLGELHVTLAYLGELDPDQAEAMAAAVRQTATAVGSLEGEVGGVGTFGSAPDAPEPSYPSIVLPDVPYLADLRAAVCEALEAAGIEYSTLHGWTPHITLAYTPEPQPPPTALIGLPLSFGTLCVARGDGPVREFPLGASVLAAAYPDGDIRAEIAAVAERHEPDGGYGDTAWNEATATVFWVCADWTTNEEHDAAEADFLAINGVENIDGEAEAYLPDGDGWEQVWPATLTASAPWLPPHPDEILDVDALVRQLRTASDPVRRAVIEAAMLPALKRASIDFDAKNPFVGAALSKTGAHVSQIAETTRLNVMRTVRVSYEQGLTIPDTANLIKEGMAAAADSRATMIARTELGQVVNGGGLAAMQTIGNAIGQAYEKRWLTAPGARFPRHELYDGLDGQTVAADDYFDVGGEQLLYPCDPDGDPGETIYCRCTLEYVEAGEAAAGAGVGGESEDSGLSGDSLAATELEPVSGSDAGELASTVVANARTMDPVLTPIVTQVVRSEGGRLEGRRFRLKSEASAERKIAGVARHLNVSEQISAGDLKDALRYTSVLPNDRFVSSMQATLDSLSRLHIVPERINTTWAKGSEYVGTNVVLRAPNGFRFEIQFHTPESLLVKEQLNHPLYEQSRLVSTPPAERLRLEKEQLRNADGIERPPGVETWTYEPSAEAHLGITPFRAGEDNPVGFYDSEKFAAFERSVDVRAREFGVTVDEDSRVTGVWEGEEEPAVGLRVHDGEEGVRAFSAALGRDYEQDAVAIFEPYQARDMVVTFDQTNVPRDQIYAAMHDLGLPAGRFLADGRLQLFGSGPEFAKQVEALARSFRVGYEGKLGRFTLLEKADYNQTIDAFRGPNLAMSPSDVVSSMPPSIESARKDVERGLALIGERLQLPENLRTVAVKIGDPHVAGRTVDGLFHPGTTREETEINVRRLAPSPLESFVHEFAHYLDFAALSKTGNRFGTMIAEHSGLGEWARAVSESPVIRAANVERTTVDVDSPLFAFLSYELDPRELWARAFTQWLSLKDSELAARVAEERSSRPVGWYWPDSEFKPVAAALDAFFRRRGWQVD